MSKTTNRCQKIPRAQHVRSIVVRTVPCAALRNLPPLRFSLKALNVTTELVLQHVAEARTRITKPLRPVKIEAERAPPFYPDHYPLIAFQLSYDEMVNRFGPSHRVMDENDNEPGPCEYWSFIFPCGLSTFIAFHLKAPNGPSGHVYASNRDVGHILKHLPIDDCIFWRLDTAEPDLYRERGGIVSSTCGQGSTRTLN